MEATVIATHDGLVQIGKFGIVGILNTAIDFSIFNVLSGHRYHFSKIVANICSTTVAMIFSFVANRQEVFNGGGGNPAIQVPLFFLTTGVSIYVLQNIVLYFMLYRWRWPGQLTRWLLQTAKLHQRYAYDAVLRNGAKVAATVVSLIWNFFMYKYVVFQ